MTAADIDRASYVRALARRIRDRLLASEREQAKYALADFEDALAAATDDSERVAVCRRWEIWQRALHQHPED